MTKTASVAAAALITVAAPFTAEATGNLELRRKVISSGGILTNSLTTGEYVTRGEFAQMLVNATSYKSVSAQECTTAVFADVPADMKHAYAIKIAVENGWMTGYLGGVFRPDDAITLREGSQEGRRFESY